MWCYVLEAEGEVWGSNRQRKLQGINHSAGLYFSSILSESLLPLNHLSSSLYFSFHPSTLLFFSPSFYSSRFLSIILKCSSTEQIRGVRTIWKVGGTLTWKVVIISPNVGSWTKRFLQRPKDVHVATFGHITFVAQGGQSLADSVHSAPARWRNLTI